MDLFCTTCIMLVFDKLEKLTMNLKFPGKPVHLHVFVEAKDGSI